MAGNEDVDGDVSGEEAAWRDLVARFDQPVDTEAAQAPWPARENLTESARDRQRPDQDAEDGWDEPGHTSPGGRPGPGGGPGPASLPPRPGGGLWPEPADEPGPDAPPAPGAAGTGPEDDPAADGTGVNGATLNGTHPDGTHPDGTNPDGTQPSGAHPNGAHPNGAHPNGAHPNGAQPNGTHTDDTNGPGRSRTGRPRIIRRAGPGRPDQIADEQDEDDRYIPPPPEPLPPLDPVTKGAWAGVLGGPGYLLIARLVDWEIPNWAALLAIVAFVAGFATLVVRMGDKPRDDDDDGAVV